jgi:hypothetical protein
MMEAANDHLVDVQMDSGRVSGNASGTIFFGAFLMGASDSSAGLAVTAPSSGGGGGGVAGMFSGMVGALSGLLPTVGVGQIKSAAVRSACDEAQCDVLGYPMYYIEEMNFFLWKHIEVTVVGFPGEIKGIKNIPRKFEVSDSYWRGSEGDVDVSLDLNASKG